MQISLGGPLPQPLTVPPHEIAAVPPLLLELLPPELLLPELPPELELLPAPLLLPPSTAAEPELPEVLARELELTGPPS